MPLPNRLVKGTIPAVALVVAASLFAHPAAATTAEVLLRPSMGPPTACTTVAGRGYEPGEPVDLAFDGSPLGEGLAGSNGRFSAKLTVPASALPGDHVVSATG